METKQASLSVLNFRKMRQDMSPATLKLGKTLYDKGGCIKAKIVSYKQDQIIIEAETIGQYKDVHSCSIEISRSESVVVFSTCGCSLGIDCCHIACLLFHLEDHFNTMLLSFLGKLDDCEVKEQLGEVEKRLQAKANKDREKELLTEYSQAGEWLAKTSLFRSGQEMVDKAELMLIIYPINGFNGKFTEVQIAVRLVGRAKPVLIQQPKAFLFSLQQKEPLVLGSQRAVLSDISFGEENTRVIEFLRRELEFFDKSDKVTKGSFFCQSALFSFLSIVSTILKNRKNEQLFVFFGTTDHPMVVSEKPIRPSFSIELVDEKNKKIVVKPYFDLDGKRVGVHDAKMVLATPPGVLLDDKYYSFDPSIDLRQASELLELDHYTIPEDLFGTFSARGVSSLKNIGELHISEAVLQAFPKTAKTDVKIVAAADLRNGELTVSLKFDYDGVTVPEIKRTHTIQQIRALNSKGKVLARDLSTEMRLCQDLIWGFLSDDKEGNYSTRSEKRIIEFVSETIPSFKENAIVTFSEPMSRCFSSEKSIITLSISEADEVSKIAVSIDTNGPLKDIDVAKVLEAAKLRRNYIETGLSEYGVFSKKLILSTQEEIEALALIIEDFAIPSFSGKSWTIPLWSIVGREDGIANCSSVRIRCSKSLKKILQSLCLVEKSDVLDLPQRLETLLHGYQKNGVTWLKRLRNFGLGGILADDMGLGKTVQAICALYEIHSSRKEHPSLIVCPTSLVDNWKEEIHRFEPSLRVATYVGTPSERRRLFAQKNDVDVIVTSYGLIQRDLEYLEKISFSYLILDEAQAIKNKETRSARSVKKLQSIYRLVLTGTPVENSLEDLWSIFDFLMPGFLGSHERFVQGYVRLQNREESGAIDFLKKRIAPFVLRRLKEDVLDDLPPISHLLYHCYLHDEQQSIYQKAAKKAQEELISLVEKQGFEKTKLHVLATLTRLKQICCHPALVDPDTNCSSAKYQMLQDLLQGLIESGHKTVLFSQYTKMLGIIRKDLEALGIPFLYLDGATKNRLQLVKKFNQDPEIPIFLISLRAGGNGLNLVGADSVIHYDMWWNPAVENQATDRVWRMGQTTKVSSYKLITKGTIEEKIVELQDRKKDIISGLVESDEDMLSKLGCEDILALLKS